MSGWARRRIQWGNHWFPLGRFKGEGVSKRERGNRNPLSLFVVFGYFLTSESNTTQAGKTG